VLRFEVPGRYERATIEPSARYPAVIWAYRSQVWRDNSARTITW
jgi:hypothetical protein